MASPPDPNGVRGRLVAAVPGFILFAALGALSSASPWKEPWFYIGLGMAVSVTFVEPFFTKPQDAIVNSAAGIGAMASVDTDPVSGLWVGYVLALMCILAAGAVAAISPGEAGTLKWMAFQLASRLGRAVVVGAAALLLLVLGAAAQDAPDFEFLAAGTVVLIAALGVDWHTVLTRVRRRSVSATALAALVS